MDKQVITAACLLLFTVPLAEAQNTPDPVAAEKEQPFEQHSSRNLFGEKKIEWVSSMRGKLIMTRREIGPFGLSQNPNVQLAAKPKKKVKPGAFLNAIRAMKVNAVMASEGTFIIGSREFKIGDAFPIIQGQRQFNIKIVSVNTNNIVFHNVDTNEYVRRNLNALPAGVSRNSSIKSVPGVIPASKKDDSPLHLDAATLPASTRQ